MEACGVVKQRGWHVGQTPCNLGNGLETFAGKHVRDC